MDKNKDNEAIEEEGALNNDTVTNMDSAEEPYIKKELDNEENTWSVDDELEITPDIVTSSSNQESFESLPDTPTGLDASGNSFSSEPPLDTSSTSIQIESSRSLSTSKSSRDISKDSSSSLIIPSNSQSLEDSAKSSSTSQLPPAFKQMLEGMGYRVPQADSSVNQPAISRINFNCELCNFTSVNESSLNKHRENVHFNCYKCDYQATDMNLLKLHMNYFHGEENYLIFDSDNPIESNNILPDSLEKIVITPDIIGATINDESCDEKITVSYNNIAHWIRDKERFEAKKRTRNSKSFTKMMRKPTTLRKVSTVRPITLERKLSNEDTFDSENAHHKKPTLLKLLQTKPLQRFPSNNVYSQHADLVSHLKMKAEVSETEKDNEDDSDEQEESHILSDFVEVQINGIEESDCDQITSEISNGVFDGDNEFDISNNSRVQMLEDTHLISYGDPGFDLNQKRTTCDMRQQLNQTVTCNLCDISFVTKDDLNKHIEYRHSEKSFICPLCSKMFDSERRLKYHITAVHSAIKDNCLGCNNEFIKILHHLKSKNGQACQAFYDMDKLIEEIRLRKRQIKHRKNNNYYQTNRETILAKSSKRYQKEKSLEKAKACDKDEVAIRNAKKSSYYHANRDRILNKTKERYQKNREKILARTTENYRKNKDKILARTSKHYYKNKEAILARSQKKYQLKRLKQMEEAGGPLMMGHEMDDDVEEVIDVADDSDSSGVEVLTAEEILSFSNECNEDLEVTGQ